MNSVKTLLAQLTQQDISLWLENDKLRYRAPQGALTTELRGAIKQHRADIIRYLRSAEQPVATVTVPQHSATNIPTVERSELMPLSFAQQRLWFIDQFETEKALYNQPVVLQLNGKLEVAALEAALNRVVTRHETLRTSFPMVEGQAYQKIAATHHLPIHQVDLQGYAAIKREQVLHKKIEAEILKPFDLTTGPLVRVALYQYEEQAYIFVVTFHHIIVDGWSIAIFFKELSHYYQVEMTGKPLSLPKLPIQYADFAVWQRESLQGEPLDRLLEYWRNHLADAPELLNLPTDYPRPAEQRYQGDTANGYLTSAFVADLKAVARSQQVSLPMLLQAAWAILLHRYSHQSNIVIGIISSNRYHQDMELLIGFFTNMLPAHFDLSADPPVAEFLQQTKRVMLAATDHQALPFERLVDELRLERSLSYQPIFQVGFNFLPLSESDLKFYGADVTSNRFDIAHQLTKFDLTLTVLLDDTDELEIQLEYSTDLFAPATIERMIGHLKMILTGIMVNPEQKVSDLPLLTEEERQQILVEWNDTRTDYPADKTIHQLFEEQVECSPDHIAVVFEDKQLTYRALNERANQLAHHLRTLGVGPEVLVGICVERSLEMVVGLLGILKAGGAYVPLDPAYPAERLAFMLTDADVPVLLTQSHLVDSLPDTQAQVVCLDSNWTEISSQSTSNPKVVVEPDNLAYVVYTSGSTGQPKGVTMGQQPLYNLIQWQLEQSQVVGKTLQFAPISFDVSFQEIFSTWCGGGTLILITEETRLDMFSLLKVLDEYQVERLFLPFIALQSLSKVIMDVAKQPVSLVEVITAGEQLHITPAIGHLFEQTRARLINQYGPTESYVVSSYVMSENVATWPELPSIGKPIANVTLYILGKNLQPVAIGVPGELYIGGDALARGYLNRPKLTTEKFIANPFGEGRLYKTGDLARWLPDGDIEFLGRIDHQVKIRGFRIELGEIETVLGQYEEIQEVLVQAKEGPGDQKQLVAYLVTTSTPSPAELRSYLSETLPDYMVPSAYVMLEEFPLTPNGKIDRKALPEPGMADLTAGSEYEPPHTPTEELLATVWQEVLGLEQVGRNDDFFMLGGHSLLATQVISRLQTLFELELGVRTLFEAPTIRGMAQLIESRSDEVAIVDFAAEVVLDPTIGQNGLAPYQVAPPQAILLTGATGFLGVYLLHDLLTQTEAAIYCLVRADGDEQAGERIRTQLISHTLWQDDWADRIIPVAGDLAQPMLGLAHNRFEMLAHQIELIYHNGAWVNHLNAYATLKPANVLGTVEVLRLATQSKLKPVHYISTTGVLTGQKPTATGLLPEDTPLNNPEQVSGGYGQSKWVAEKLLDEASQRGVPVVTYRPGIIGGHSQTGFWQSQDFRALQIKASLQLKHWPESERAWAIAPVDFVSQAIVYLSQQPESIGEKFHITSPHQLSRNQFFEQAVALGHDLQPLPRTEWQTLLQETATTTQDQTLQALLPFYARASQPEASPRKQTVEGQIDNQQTMARLADSGLVCPPVDQAIIERYLAYLLANSPSDFPITWEDPAHAQQFWGWNSSLFPEPITPLGYNLLIEPFYTGYNKGYTDLEASMFSQPTLFNTYVYVTTKFEGDGIRYDEAKLDNMVDRLETLWCDVWLPEIKLHLDKLAIYEFDTSSWSDLLTSVEGAIAICQRLWEIHGELANPMLVPFYQFEELYQDLLADALPYTAYDLLDVEPSKTARGSYDLWLLSQQVAADSALATLFETTPESGLVAAVQQTAFWPQIQTYLEQYGQQAQVGYIRLPSWEENSLPVLRGLKHYLQQPGRNLETVRQEKKERAAQAIAAARAHLKNYPQPVVDEFERLLNIGQFAYYLRDEHAHWLDIPIAYHTRRIALVLGQYLVQQEVLDKIDDLFYLYFDEIKNYNDDTNYRPLVAQRRQELAHFAQVNPPAMVGTVPTEKIAGMDSPLMQATFKHIGDISQMPPPTADQLVGQCGSGGTVQGRVKILKSPTEIDQLEAGDILVTVTTTPDWSPCFAKIGGLITDTGGVLSHAAVVARELGLPAVVGAVGATSFLQDGQLVELDGQAGEVRVLA